MIQNPTLLLATGAMAGALLAATGIFPDGDLSLDTDRVASVNGETISKSDYLGYLDLLARDKRNPMTAADRRHVLERVIEEKLLIARGLEIDLPYSDPTVRKTIVNAMIQVIISDASSSVPSDTELEAFYAQNQNYFTQPARIQVRRLVFRGADAETRAAAAHEALRNRSWEEVKTSFGDSDILDLPGSHLPISKLRGYLGPTLAAAAQQLSPGEHSPPLSDQSGYTILQLLDLQRGAPPALDGIREQVAREYQRRAGDDALREYLQQLRAGADIVMDEAFLSQLDELAGAGGG